MILFYSDVTLLIFLFIRSTPSLILSLFLLFLSSLLSFFLFYNGLGISHHHYDYNPLQHTILSPLPSDCCILMGFVSFFAVEHSHTQTFYYYVLSTLVCPLLLHLSFEWTEIRYLLISLGPEIYNKFLSKLHHLCGKPILKSYFFLVLCLFWCYLSC